MQRTLDTESYYREKKEASELRTANAQIREDNRRLRQVVGDILVQAEMARGYSRAEKLEESLARIRRIAQIALGGQEKQL